MRNIEMEYYEEVSAEYYEDYLTKQAWKEYQELLNRIQNEES